MKKFLLIGVLTLGFTACGGDEAADYTGNSCLVSITSGEISADWICFVMDSSYTANTQTYMETACDTFDDTEDGVTTTGDYSTAACTDRGFSESLSCEVKPSGYADTLKIYCSDTYDSETCDALCDSFRTAFEATSLDSVSSALINSYSEIIYNSFK